MEIFAHVGKNGRKKDVLCGTVLPANQFTNQYKPSLVQYQDCTRSVFVIIF